MNDVPVERRLVAILAADIVGYSRLVEQDEARTLASIKTLRREVIDPLLARHHGRIVKLTGDGAIVEFGSVVDAVKSAVAIQKETAARQAEILPERRIVYRVGINLGDVVAEDGDLLGDGVNIAARLEQLCDPGGILISGTAYDQLQGKFDRPLDFAGKQHVKNIVRPVRTYHVRLDGSGQPWRLRLKSRSRQLRAAAAVAILVAAAGWAWWFLGSDATKAAPPAIAVLPFENLSEDSKWDRFADGITEDIITDLARFRDIPVIARTSTEVYRGKQQDVRAIGEALDVGYVLEGSLRIDLHRLRVTAKLVNTKNGEHVWSERYDRSAGDFFAVQDDITEKIAATLTGWQSPISQAQKAAAKRKSATELDAYDYWLLGAAEKHKVTPASVIEARKLFEKGLALDPDFQPLVRDLGWTYAIGMWLGGAATDRDVALRKLDELSARAVELDPQDPLATQLWSVNAGLHGEYGTQRERVERALSLGPNNADLLVLAASEVAAVGIAERGPELADRALRLNPHHPHWWDAVLTQAYFHGGEFTKAYPLARRLGLESPRVAAYQAMIAAELGKASEAKEAAAAVLRLDPGWSAEAYYALPMEKDRKFVAKSARKVGLPVCMTAEQIEANPPMTRYEECEERRASTAIN